MFSRAVRERSQMTRRASLTGMPAHERTVTNARRHRLAGPFDDQAGQHRTEFGIAAGRGDEKEDHHLPLLRVAEMGQSST